ncbi:aquaporin [Actinobacillus equuli subsp. haemolyticus]|uniref:aquaporin n=1 Tax=Actinobacillus equuli TaxID=718 RepID=UPI00241832C7|nr:aquaporin [Actinobacillus equuli]MDG4947294.1 aquaporin [Actinobacillus equuli subsp. haemolyticus]
MKKYFAEFFGTFWLVFGGCGSAVLAAGIPELGIGYAGVSLAFGLTVLTMAYAVGHISGGHFNPAVSIGLLVGGRFNAKDLVPYIIAQVLGAIAAAAVLYTVASGMAGFDVTAGFAPIAIGLGLTLIHLISIPVTNTSVNPARSTGVALFQGSWAIEQLWLFWVAPIVGAIIGALVYRFIAEEK